MAATYEHYFVADGGRVVSHKPVNLCVWAKCGGGPARAFTLAVKTSDDKIKRRLNKTEALAECYLCCDTDPAYMRRRSQQDAAAAAAALLGHDVNSAAGAAATAPVPSTKAQMAARQEQLHYIGSKEIFVQHPGDKIVCLRLRAAEEPAAPTRKGKGRKAAAAEEDDGDDGTEAAESAPAATPPPADVGETSTGGFLFHVETKGGKSLGRQKQHYILLRSRCIYTLLLPTDVVVTRIETKDKQGDVLALKHWISAHAQLATGPTACPTKFSAPEPEAAVPAVPVTMPVTSNLAQQQQQQQQALAFMTASSLHAASAAAFSAQLQMGNSPFSSQSISPASMGAAFAQPAAAPGSGISPSNQPFLFPFNTHSPQQAAQLLVQQQQQQYLAASTALAGLSGFPAASALSMMLPSSGPNSRGHTNSFPSPSNVLLSNALMLGGGLSSTLMSPALSNPPSNRSNVGMSTNFSPSNGVLLHTQQAHANQRQDSPPSAGAPRIEAHGGGGGSGDAEARQIQQQILQLQSILNQQTQLAKQQQMQLEQHQLLQQQQFSQYSQQQQQQQRTAKVVPALSRSKFDFGVGHGNAANAFPQMHTVFHQQQQTHAQQQQQQHQSPHLHHPQQSVSPTRGLFQPKGFGEASGGGNADPFDPVKAEAAVHCFPDSPQFAPSRLRALQGQRPSENNTSSAGSTATNSLSNSAEGLGGFVRPPGHGSHTHGYLAAQQHHQQQHERFEPSPGADASMMMQLDHTHPHSHASPSAGALHSAYWNPPAPPMAVAMSMSPPVTQGPDLGGLLSSPDFLAEDDFFSADPTSAGMHHHNHQMHQHSLPMEVPQSFFNSPLVHDSTESAGSSNASHASHSPIVQPMRLQSQRQAASVLQQQQQGGLSRSPSVDSLVPASALAAALRPPAFPLLGANILLDPSHSSSSSASGGRRAGKRKKSSSRRRDLGASASPSSATSSVVSESARPSAASATLARRATGFTLSPRLWKVALKKPPFRATLSVTRSSPARFRSSDLVQIRFGGEMLDPSRVDVYKRQVLIDIPPPPSTAAVMSAAGVAPHVAASASSSSGMAHTTIEVDLELLVNGALKFATSFSYKLGPAASSRGDATTSSSSEGDSDDDDDSGDRSDSASDDDLGGGGGGGGGSPGSPDSPGGSPDSPGGDDDSGKSKRRKADDSSNRGGGGGGSGGGTQHGNVPRQSVRLSADLDAIPLFARGVLKSFPLLSLGLQDLLQSYLLQATARGEDNEEVSSASGSAAAVHDQMIVEEVDADFLAVPAASTLAARSSPSPTAAAAAGAAGGARKRYSTGSHVLEKLKAAQTAAAKTRMSPPSGPVAASQTVPSTPVTRSPLRQRGRSRSAASMSAANRNTARILFVQAISSQQPMQLVHAALSAATHAALHPDAASSSHFPFEGINGADSFGFTLLHYAVAAGSLPLVETLLSLGANPGIQARSNHASHAFTPAQLLQLRVVAEQQRAARREARAARKATASPSAALGRLLSRHGKKKRRTSGGGDGGVGGGDNDEGSLASGPSQSDSAGSSGNSENGHQSCSEDSAMVDGHVSGEAAAVSAAGSSLFVGFSSLHSLAPSPFGSAHSSAASSLASTPTNANAALKAARTPLTGRDILAAAQSGSKKSFHFGLGDRASASGGGGGGSLSSSPPAEKFFQHVQMQMHQQMQQHHMLGGALHVYHAHQMMHGPVAHFDKAHAAAAAGGAAGHSTATTAAPTPSSNMNSVLSSPMPNAWRPSPMHQPQQHVYASSMRSPPLGSLVAHAGVPALTGVAPSATDAAELNRQMGVIFHAHALSPQGLAMAAALAQSQAANAASEQLHSSAGTASSPALTHCPQLHAYVERRWRHVHAKKQLLSLQRQLRQLHAQQSPSSAAAAAAAASTMVQSEEDREHQRETVMLELARLIQHAQRHIAALKLHVAPSSVAAEGGLEPTPALLLSGPMRSLHIHTLSSLLSQFHLLRRYFLAHRKHQAEQAQLNNALAGIQLSDEREEAFQHAPRSRPVSTASVSSVSLGAFEPAAAVASSPSPSPSSSEPASVSASPVPAQDDASRSASPQSPQAQPLSDASIIELLSHAAAVESALRDRIVHMQRVLVPYMQRAMLQAKMSKERSRAAQMQVQLRDAAAQNSAAGPDASMTSPRSLSSSSRSLPPPLSQGHLSRTHSGQLSLNIVGSIHPDREDAETARIHVREIHGVDVLHCDPGCPGRRIDLAINPALQEQESAAEVARDSARKQHGRNWEGDLASAASSRLQSPAAVLASSSNKPAELAPSLFVAPHSTPAASVASTPAARDSTTFHFHPAAATASSPRLGGCTASSSSPRSIPLGNKFALLVGLNTYDPALSLAPLLGCENDVNRMMHVLQRFGYDAPVHVAQQHDAPVAAGEEALVEFDRCRSILLLNAQATRATFRRALVSLVRAAHSPADAVLIYFSGHGLSSSLLLYDGAVEYAEMTQLLEEIRTGDVTFVSDTCATDSVPMDAAAAAASSCNKSLTLEELRRLVNNRDAAVATAAQQQQQHAAAEILAAISPEPPVRRIAPRLDLPASSSFSSSPIAVMRSIDDADNDNDNDALVDAEESASDDDMDTQSAAAAPASKRRSGGRGARVQYRGLAFNQIEPREPSSDEPCTMAAAPDSPCSGGASDDEQTGDSAVFPVIQRLLQGRGYFARGLLSRSDARASEVRLQDGTWQGAYTKRLCDKLERFAAEADADADVQDDAEAEVDTKSPVATAVPVAGAAATQSRRAEPANPRVVRLSAVLFHDEEDGNLSGRDCSGGNSGAPSGCGSASSSRSNSFSGASWGPLLSEHQADEIDPTSATADLDLDLAQVFAAARLDAPDSDGAAVVSPLVADLSGSDEDDNGDHDAASCAAEIAAFDAADWCATDGVSADEEAQLLHESDEEDDDAFRTEEPAQLPVAVEPRTWLALLLSIWSLVRIAVAGAPAAVPESTESDSPVSAPVAVSFTPKSFAVLAPSPSPSPSLEHVAADLLTTEAASDSSASCSTNEQYGAHGSDSDAPQPDQERAAHKRHPSLPLSAAATRPHATFTHKW